MEYLFETENLKIRKFVSVDAERLYEIHLEDEVKRWIPNESYADIDETKDAVQFFLDRSRQETLPYVLAVESKMTGELIGDTGINEVEGDPSQVEIGYVISQAYSGKGYATELVRTMTEFVVKKFHVKTLYGRVMKGNDASVRVLEKNGYVFVKEEFGAEDDPYNNGMLIYRKDAG
ncbi:MAG: GNAT family N-acetyltransferase [Clostridiales bacterium]|nr:GNAT family N-acetyltransferase [Clostridiales bacterium]